VKFLQVSIRLERSQAEHAEALLNLAGAQALTFDDAADTPLFEPAPGTTPLWPQLVLHALFPQDFDGAGLQRMLAAALPGLASIGTRSIDAADWQAGLEQEVFVRRITDTLAVVPADFSDDVPATHTVRLHMGLAFGTGRHPTTTLCLQWLAAHAPVGQSVCDFGCGSGILAIAALELGATTAIAIDNDPQAVQATRSNARLNGVESRLHAGSSEDFGAIAVDLVMANILAGTLQESVDSIAAMLQPRGKIVLSGILTEQAESVAAAFAQRFESFTTSLLEGWACITARLR
jgi:ribosomal protein L11 methyltransferase